MLAAKKTAYNEAATLPHGIQGIPNLGNFVLTAGSTKALGKALTSADFQSLVCRLIVPTIGRGQDRQTAAYVRKN